MKRCAIHSSGNEGQPHLILFDSKSLLSLFKNMMCHILDTQVIQSISVQALFHMRFRGGNQHFDEM